MNKIISNLSIAVLTVFLSTLMSCFYNDDPDLTNLSSEADCETNYIKFTYVDSYYDYKPNSLYITGTFEGSAKITFDSYWTIAAHYERNENGELEIVPLEEGDERTYIENVVYTVDKVEDLSSIEFNTGIDSDSTMFLIHEKVENIEVEYSECSEIVAVSDDEIEEEKELEIEINTGDPNDITTNSFVIKGSSIVATDVEIDEFGILYTTITSADSVRISSDGDVNDFDIQISDLEPNTSYIVSAYALIGESLVISNDVIVVKTLEDQIVLPIVSNGVVQDESTTINSITIISNSITDGTPSISEYGIAYATVNDSTQIIDKVESDGSMSSYAVEITGLTANTTYYVWAYAVQGTDYIYSDASIEVMTADVTFKGISYKLTDSDYLKSVFMGTEFINLNMNRFNGEVQDFNINLELSSTTTIIAGTYTFEGTTLSLTSSSEVGLDNESEPTKKYAATGGSVILTIVDGDYVLDMDITLKRSSDNDEGTLLGTYTIPAGNGF